MINNHHNTHAQPFCGVTIPDSAINSSGGNSGTTGNGGANANGGSSINFAGGSTTGATRGQHLAYWGDLVVSCVCFPLVLAQLLRHLFDFRGPCDGRCPMEERDVEAFI